MKDYYMVYESFDYEDHYPIGIFDDFEELKEKVFERYSDELPYSMTGYCLIKVYEVQMNECFDFMDLKEMKDWWKK